jgi:hypothetical protein
VEGRRTWIEEGKDVANGRLCGSVIATRKVKRVRPSIGALHSDALVGNIKNVLGIPTTGNAA